MDVFLGSCVGLYCKSFIRQSVEPNYAEISKKKLGVIQCSSLSVDGALTKAYFVTLIVVDCTETHNCFCGVLQGVANAHEGSNADVIWTSHDDWIGALSQGDKQRHQARVNARDRYVHA